MGLFNIFSKTTQTNYKAGDTRKNRMEEIVLAPSFHMAEDEFFGDKKEDGGYITYRMSFQVNDAFKEAKSHAAEVEMLHTYAPDSEYGQEGAVPYLAIQIDEIVYTAVVEYKEKGTFTGAMELTPLSGKFFFRAKVDYYKDIMYFYGIDCCDGIMENSGLCMVYPKAYVGTENEAKLMQVLDEAAESYCEEKTA